MQTFTITYNNPKQIEQYIKDNGIDEKSSILIQIYTGINCSATILELIHFLQGQLPESHIIGATSAGEISNSQVSFGSILISFSIFDKTTIRTALVEAEDSFTVGKKLAQQLVCDNTKVMVIFGNILLSGEDMLLGIATCGNNDFIVAGGNAGNNGFWDEYFVFSDDQITYTGAAGFTLNSDSLTVYNDANFCWNGIGKVMTVTKAIKNRIYSIDGVVPRTIYKKYLGSKIADYLPSSATEFPFLFEIDGINIARCPFKCHPDESIEFIGDIPEGTKVVFSYGDLNLLMGKAGQIVDAHNQNRFESIFVYACTARQAFLQEHLEYEINVALPICGFLTYGEYYQDFITKKNYMLNITTTYLALSEEDKLLIRPAAVEKQISDKNFVVGKKTAVTEILANLINAVVRDLEQQQEIIIEREKAVSLGHLIAGITHNLKTPLMTSAGGVLALIKIAEKLKKNEVEAILGAAEVEKWARDIDQNVKYIAEIIHTVCGYISNNESYNQEFDIDELIKKIDILMEHELKVSNCRLDKEIIVDKHIKLEGNINDLLQTINILISNAIGAYKTGKGDIKLLIKKESEERLQISVTDYGSGIATDVERKIFKQMITTKGKNGTGLGLYTANIIIRGRFNGNISLIDTSDNGSTFQISIPVTKEG